MTGRTEPRPIALAPGGTRRTAAWGVAVGITVACLLSGCDSSIQSALVPRGPYAARLVELWWVLFAVCTAVYLIVVGLLFYALLRRRRPQEASGPGRERGKTRAVATGVVATVLILFVLLVYSVFTGRAIATPPDDTEALTIEVIGHQFWWEVQYLDSVPSQNVTTAHEIHIPVGQPVRVQVQTRDVIHSFWVPNLHGKVDLIPGQVNTIWLQADAPGVFRGQCAEFCGLQHALMGFLVIAQPPAEFAAWLEHQRQPAALPTDPAVARGQEVFLSAPCILCHTVRGTGTGAMGRVAPDLTHFGSRRTIAAATLPNTRGNLAGWILDPQHIKPGNRMPAVHLAPADLQFLLDYLESLK